MNEATGPHLVAKWLRSNEFDEFIRLQMQAAHIPGLSLAIIDQGDLVHAAGFGLADIAAGRTMTPQTLINVASITKTITCTAVMQLYEQGKLQLGASIDEYLPFKVRNPAFPDRPVTPRQLLTHTSSIADGPAYKLSYLCGDPQVTLLEWLQQYLTPDGKHFDAKENFKVWAPGGPHAYSNVGYGVLGLMVEGMSGLPYADYCIERIFAPLGMTDSRFLLAGMPREKHATPYDYVTLIDPEWSAFVDPKEGMHVPHCLYSFPTMPDGLARTTAAELAQFLMAHIQSGALGRGRILRPETIGKVLSDQHVQYTQPSNVIQGLAWYQHESIWGHGGGDPGVSTYMGFRPTDGRGIVMLANVGGARTEIVDRVFAWANVEH
jgi:CubicO group peptidase (beta-lactamase class C family)